jgi:hypothetical protein
MVGIALVLSGLILASASDLELSGGTVQVFRYQVEIEGPTTPAPVEMSSIPDSRHPADVGTTVTTVGP